MPSAPMPPPKRARLYAMLMREEFHRRGSKPSEIGGDGCPLAYVHFLKANRRHGDKLCPYGIAVKMTEGR